MSSKNQFIEFLLNEEKSSFKIVFLCSGNVIRSPFAEFLARKYVDYPSKQKLIFESGACTYQNSSILPFTRKWLLKKGFSDKEIRNHNPRLITNYYDDFFDTDLFIGMTKEHIAHIKEIFPTKNAYLLKELVLGKNEDILDPYLNSVIEDQIMEELDEMIYEFCALINENLK